MLIKREKFKSNIKEKKKNANCGETESNTKNGLLEMCEIGKREKTS